MVFRGHPLWQATRVAGVYALVAGCWVAFSDAILLKLVPDAGRMNQLSMLKGLLFVAVTALLLFLFVSRIFRRNLQEAFLREQAQSEQAERYRLLFDASPVPMWAFDVDTLQFVAVNAAAIEIYGYSREEWLAMSTLDIRPEEDQSRWLEHLQSLAPGFQHSGVWTHKTRSGQLIRADISSHVTTLHERPVRLISMRDVTAQEQTAAALAASEARWEFAIESSNDAVFDWNLATGRTFVTPRFCQMLGFATCRCPEEGLDHWPADVHPEDRAMVQRGLEAHLRGESVFYRCEYRVVKEDGSPLWVLVRGKVMERNLAGSPLRMMGTITDISDRKRIEQRLKLAAAVFEHSREGQFLLDAEFRLVSFNRAFSQITGLETTDRVLPLDAIGGAHAQWPVFASRLLDALRRDGDWEGEGNACRADGAAYPFWLSITRLHGEPGDEIRYAGLLVDITERRAQDERIHFLSYYDPLTQLPNRQLGMDRLSQQVILAQRKQEKLAVLLLDLDRFSAINDSLGHAVGDQLLKVVATRLQYALRASDVLARQGGDEMMIALPGIWEAGQAARIAEKLLATLHEPVMVDEHEFSLSASIGISLYPDDGQEATLLLQNADSALNQVKRGGRGGYRFYTSEMNSHIAEQLSLESALRQALPRQQIVVHYQPQVDARGGLTGVEALVRWQHPERGLVPPGLFIPLAEERGIIVELGEWILREACRQSMFWRACGYGRVPVAVNLSAIQFQDRLLPDKVAQALKETGLPPEDLELEITESVLMDANNAAQTFSRLQSMGVRFSIDDFGTGFSSLAYLRRFPVSKLKIDRSFVNDLHLSDDARAVVRTIIELARSLNLRTIAEGVESAAQWQALADMGCDELQGFHFSRPLPPQDLEQWLHRAPPRLH